MGKFKTALVKLKTGVENVDKQLEDYGLKLTSVTTDMATACGMLKAGYEVAYMYIAEQYKAQGSNIKKHRNDTLKDIKLDNALQNMIREIGSAQKKAIDKRIQFEAIRQTMKSTLAENEVNSAQVATLRTDLAKKKQKLISSPLYKKKVKAYEETLEGVASSVAEYKKLCTQSIENALELKTLKSWTLTLDTTMDDLMIRAGSSDLDDKIASAQNGTAAVTKKFRNSQKFMKSDLALIKDWIGDADDMEKSTEGV